MGPNKNGNQISYTSPCSPSSGSHSYTITLFALSNTPISLPSHSTIDINYSTLITAFGSATVLDTAVLTFNDVNE